MSELNKLQGSMMDPAFKQDFQDYKGKVDSHGGQLTNQESRLNILENDTGKVAANISGLYRETAWLKLKQEADDRIDGGVTFADDMNGNRFGFELNEAESQNVKIRDGKMLMIEDIEVQHSAVDEVVVSQAYSTEGNGGRKLVRLNNGWLVASVTTNTSPKRINLYVSKDGGMNWEELCHVVHGGTSNFHSPSMIAYGNVIYLLTSFINRCFFFIIDAETQSNVNIYNKSIDVENGALQTEVGTNSLAIDPTNGHLHAAWASKNSTYPNSFNIRYSKSVDDGVTWSAVEQKTTRNGAENAINPCVVVVNSKPVIIYSFVLNNAHNLFALVGSSTANTTIHNGGTYSQSSPSAVVDKDGVIHVAWYGRDSANPTKESLFYSNSVNGGVNWSVAFKVAVDYAVPSITADASNKIFITAQNMSVPGIHFFEKTLDAWSIPIRLSSYVGSGLVNSSTLHDANFNITFTKPLTIHQTTTNVLFSGEWSEQVEVPKTLASAVYDIPSTDFVGAFVKKQGAVTASAFLNDVRMDSTLNADEYQFETPDLLPSPVPAKLRIELSRVDTTGGENDAITRILGGRA